MAKAKQGNWIAKATANSHGQFKAKAQKAGMSTMDFANHATAPGSKASMMTKKQASLAKNLMQMK